MNVTRQFKEAAIAGRLLPLARTWRRLADRALEEQGLSAAVAWALTHLDRLGPDVRQTDLADAMEIAPASLVPLLHQLEEAALVTRIADNQDRRTRRIAMTEGAKPVVIESERILAALRSRMMADLDDETLGIVMGALKTMSATAASLSLSR